MGTTNRETVGGQTEEHSGLINVKYQVLRSEAEVRELINFHNQNSRYVILDTETTSKDPLVAKLVDIQLSGKTEDSAVLFGAEFAPLLLELCPNLILVACYAKYDQHVLFRHGVDLLSRTWRCTVLLGHLADENRESYSLESYVTEIYGGTRKSDFWDKYENYLDAPETERVEYACADIVETNAVYQHIAESLKAQEIPETLQEHVNRLSASLLRTEIEGISVDVEHLTNIGVKMKAAMEALDPQMRECVSTEINLVEMRLWSKRIAKYKTDAKKASTPKPEFSFSSPDQIKSLLYDVLELPIQYNQKTKAPSTDWDALQKLKDLHPFVPLFIQWREYPVIYNTFIQGTLEKMQDGRIYPGFKINGTKGARISHENPNMGNIPASGEVKGIFVPDDGEEFSEFDFSQLEVCIEAHLTQDKNLLAIVCDGASKHDITAHALGIPRPIAKTVNFAMQYHCGPEKVAKILGVSKQEGEYAWNKFWETYSGPKKLKEYTDKRIDDGLPLIDLFGRRRRFESKKRKPWDKAYRSGYNFVVQSPGGQMMNNACYKANELFRANKVGKVVLTVHDSGLISTKKEHTQIWAPKMAEIMINEGCLIGLSVPLKVSSSIGMPRWLDK